MDLGLCISWNGPVCLHPELGVPGALHKLEWSGEETKPQSSRRSPARPRAPPFPTARLQGRRLDLAPSQERVLMSLWGPVWELVVAVTKMKVLASTFDPV